MTPAQAIRHECATCKGGARQKCESRACALRGGGSSLRRIKVHCRECAGDDHPRECTGRLLDGGTCILHDFRLGRNPFAKKRILSPEHREKAIARLAKHRRDSSSSASISPPGSKIATSGILEGDR